jgi:hypothetical protein
MFCVCDWVWLAWGWLGEDWLGEDWLDWPAAAGIEAHRYAVTSAGASHFAAFHRFPLLAAFSKLTDIIPFFLSSSDLMSVSESSSHQQKYTRRYCWDARTCPFGASKLQGLD